MNVFSVTDVVVTEGKTGSIGKSASELQKLNASCVFTLSVHLIVVQYNILCGASRRRHAAFYNAPNNPRSTQQPKRPWAVDVYESVHRDTIMKVTNKMQLHLLQSALQPLVGFGLLNKMQLCRSIYYS